MVLSEKTGNIYFCPAAHSGIAPITPIGSRCGVIGAIPATSLSGNGFVSMSFASAGMVQVTGVQIAYGVTFVGNLATGTIVECTYQYDPAGNGTGQCVPVANSTSLP